MRFYRKTYKKLRNKDPQVFREDFCGTHQLCCEWVKLDKSFLAIGNDIDAEPIQYGQEHNYGPLNPQQKARVTIANKNVLSPPLQRADISVAVNFSYLIFKERDVLKRYFANCARALNPGGIHILDLFGGSECMGPLEEETEYTDQKYSYFWDQDTYNPINSHAMFYIHFKRKGEPKRERVFTYDWRLWSIAELRDLCKDAGFRKTTVYWEGTDKKTEEGDGQFRPTEQGEACEGWIAYIVCEK